MLPWQKKRKEEAALKAKEMEEVTTSVIGDKETNDEIVKETTTEVKEKEKPEQIELDAQEIGLINIHRTNLQVQLKIIDVLEQILAKLDEINKKA